VQHLLKLLATDGTATETAAGGAELMMACGCGCDHGGGTGAAVLDIGGGTPIIGRGCDPDMLTGGWPGPLCGGPTMLGGSLMGGKPGGGPPDVGGGCCHGELGG